MPKSYIAAVKPAAFGRVLGKATHTTGAQIKLKVHALTFFFKHWYWSDFSQQFIAGALTLQKMWAPLDQGFDVEASIGIANMPAEDFT